MSEKKNLMEAIYANGFAADEARLFLDTHPNDPAALQYYNQKIKLYHQAVAHYEEKYGPIRPENGGAGGSWQWAITPWPWEGGDE